MRKTGRDREGSNVDDEGGCVGWTTCAAAPSVYLSTGCWYGRVGTDRRARPLPDVRIYFLNHYANPSPTQLGHFCAGLAPARRARAYAPHRRVVQGLPVDGLGAVARAAHHELAPLAMRADVPSRALLSHDHGPRYPRRHAGDGRQTAEHHPEGGGDAAQSLGRGRAAPRFRSKLIRAWGLTRTRVVWDEQNGLDDDERRSNSSAMSAIPRDVRYLACVRLATAPQRGSRAVRDGGPGRRVHARPRLRGPGLRRVLPARLRRPSSRDRPERGGRRRRAARFPTLVRP